MALATLNPEKEADSSPPASNGDKPKPPPLPGSIEEYAETAVTVGWWPDAYGVTCRHVEMLLRASLIWREE